MTMAPLAATIRALDTGLRICAALCMAIMFALMVAQVVLRYTATSVPVFTEELARYAMVWMALFSTAVAVRDGNHIRLDFAPDLLARAAPQAGRALAFILDLITLTICLTIFWQGLDIVAFAAAQRSDGLRIPMSWPYAAMPLAFGVATIFALARLAVWERRQ
mgnify:CR=1 FL=1